MASKTSWGLVAGAAGVGIATAWLRKRNRMELRGRTVFVTGGSRGLGLVLARRFGERGALVAICARDERELASAAHDLSRQGIRSLPVRANVADAEEVADALDEVERRLGPVDVLVNNAGIIQVGPASSMTPTDFDDAMDVNFRGTVNTTMTLLPRMVDRGFGRIVNVTSIGGWVSMPHLLPYSCAKAATIGFSEGLAAELAGTGVRVTTVVPGLMRTGSSANARFKGDAEAEYTWFTLGASTPLTAMSADRAARRIVRAAEQGERFVVLTWQAKLLRLTHDLMPSGTTAALGAIARLLPGPAAGDPDAPANAPGGTRGMRLAGPLAPSTLTALGNRAGREYNEYGGTPEPSRAHAEQVGLIASAEAFHLERD